MPALPLVLKAEPGALAAFPGVIGSAWQLWLGWPLMPVGLAANTAPAGASVISTAITTTATNIDFLIHPFRKENISTSARKTFDVT